MKSVLEGYAKFRKEVFPKWKDHFHLLAEIQAPTVLFITCSDSRIDPSLMLQTEPGDLFICRNAGNVVPPMGEMAGGVSATVEYAIEVLKVKHVILCGHSDCGAIKAVVAQQDLTNLPLTAQWLHYVESAWKYRETGISEDNFKARHEALIRANVIAQLVNLCTHPEVARGLSQQTLQVHGWYYDILTGAIEEYDQQQRKFIPLEELAATF